MHEGIHTITYTMETEYLDTTGYRLERENVAAKSTTKNNLKNFYSPSRIVFTESAMLYQNSVFLCSD